MAGWRLVPNEGLIEVEHGAGNQHPRREFGRIQICGNFPGAFYQQKHRIVWRSLITDEKIGQSGLGGSADRPPKVCVK